MLDRLQVLGILGVAMVSMVVVFLMPIHHDEAVFLTIGREMQRGKLLYVDVFDHKPPGIHVLSQLVSAIGGGVMVARLMVLSVNVVSTVLVFGIVRSKTTNDSALVAAGVFLLLAMWWHGGYFLAEPFVVMLFLVGWWIVDRHSGVMTQSCTIESGGNVFSGRDPIAPISSGLQDDTFKQVGWYMLVGAVCGVMVWMKQTGLVLGVVLGVKIFLDTRKLDSLFWWGAGLVGSVSLMLWWLWQQGVMGQAFESVVWFNLLAYRPQSLWQTLVQLPYIVWPAAILLVVTMFLMVRRKMEPAIAVGILLLTPLLLSRPYHHYWLLVLPLLVVSGFGNWMNSLKWIKLSGMVAGIYLIGMSFTTGWQEQHGQLAYWEEVELCSAVDDPVGYWLTECEPGKYFFQPPNLKDVSHTLLAELRDSESSSE